MKDNYFANRAIDVNEKIKEVRKTLPSFANEFFMGIEHRTSPLTRLNYAHDLKTFFNFLYGETEDFYNYNKETFTINDLNRVEALHIEQFISYLSAYRVDGRTYTNNQSAKSRKLACIRTFFKYFYNKDKLTRDVASKVAMPKINTKPIIKLEVNEMQNLLDEVDNARHMSNQEKAFHSKTRLRDIAIISLFLGTGIRISELVGLNVEDIDFYNSAFIVTRKGGNQEILYFNEDVSLALLEYVENRFELLDEAHKDESALFISLQHNRISLRAVENLVKKYAHIASPLKKITPHKLRSTFGTNLYKKTNDIYVVAEMLGHKDVNVTKKHYADTSEQIKRKAISQVVLRDNSKQDNKN